MGANTASRVPTTSPVSPRAAACQRASRAAVDNPLCNTVASMPGSAWAMRVSSCGVRLISGTNSNAWRPAAMTRAAAAK